MDKINRIPCNFMLKYLNNSSNQKKSVQMVAFSDTLLILFSVWYSKDTRSIERFIHLSLEYLDRS